MTWVVEIWRFPCYIYSMEKQRGRWLSDLKVINPKTRMQKYDLLRK